MSKDHTPPLPVSLTAADRYRFGAMHYPAHGEPQARPLIAGATGSAQRFYSPFATFAASHGIAIWTLDYRGVGPFGHMGYFKPRAEALWRETLEWLRASLSPHAMP